MLYSLISRISNFYTRLLMSTVRWDLSEGCKDSCFLKDSIIGFWHGDSYTASAFLRKVYNGSYPLKVIVTADRRGDCIENGLKTFGVEALRVHDGIKAKDSLRMVMEESAVKGGAIGIALDGPLGPFHEVKKLGPMLSRHSEKRFLGIKFQSSKKIRIKKRWDNYEIIFPFSKVKVCVYDFGIITRDEIRDFRQYKEEIKCQLL